MRVLFLPRYDTLGASSRQRCYMFLPLLLAAGIACDTEPLLANAYLDTLYSGGKKSWRAIARSYAYRLRRLINSRHYDLVWIEKESLPWLPAWIELAILKFANVRFVLDYDDAIFHIYDESPKPLVRLFLARKIDRLMARADMVIVGSAYLAQRAAANKVRFVVHLPTVIDLGRYPASPVNHSNLNRLFTIGWIGTGLTSKYLEIVRTALTALGRQLSIRILLIGAAPGTLSGLPVEYRNWRGDTEVADLGELDVGIMPLPDRPFERGKCGYKLIQYMGSWLPVVASPVGANRDIIDHGVNGFLADSSEEWLAALTKLAGDRQLRARMGAAGRRHVEWFYSLDVAAPRLSKLLFEASGVVPPAHGRNRVSAKRAQ